MEPIQFPRLWREKDGLYSTGGDSSTRRVYQAFGSSPPTQEEMVTLLNEDKLSWDYCDLFLKGIAYRAEHVDLLADDEKTNLIALPSGCYNIIPTNSGHVLRPFTLRADEGVHLGNTQTTVERDLENFLKGRKLYDQMRLLYKRGYLFYGPPGNGKTNLIRTVVRQLLKGRDLIVIFMRLIPSSALLKSLEPDPRIKIFVVEELTQLAEEDSDGLLTFLDGENSISSSIVFATTNYSGALPRNLVQRPGRFDRVIRFDDPDEELRQRILAMYGYEATSRDIEETDGLSAAALGEVFRRHMLQGISIVEAAKEFLDQVDQAEKDFGNDQKEIGFGHDSKAPRTP
jgi:hypothetical protein